MAQVFTAAGTNVGGRFNVVSTIPTLVLIAVLGGLAVSGAPFERPDPSKAAATVSNLTLVGAGTVALLVVAIGLVTHSFQTRLVKSLEGYTESSFSKRILAGRADAYRRRAEWVNEHGRSPRPLNPAEEREPALIRERAARALAERSRYPTDLRRVMPTRLGNVLRSAEDYAGRERYGLDAIFWIPLIYPLMSPAMVAWLDDTRTELDVNVRFTWMWATVALGSTILLMPTLSPWLVISLVALGLAHISYFASIEAATSYGIALARAIDIYRFEALDALHLALPRDHDTERKWFPIVEAMLKNRSHPDARELLVYARPGTGPNCVVSAKAHAGRELRT